MTTPIIGLIALLVIAIIGWAIAEAKSKAIEFTHSKEDEAYEHDGGKELSLKDLLKKNYTRGYESI